MGLRKKTQNHPSNCTSWRLNPQDQLGRPCVCGMCKRSLRAPTKENAVVLTAVDVGDKNTQEQEQIRIWAAPTAGPEISTVLEGIPGRWGGLWLLVRERPLTAVTQDKHLLFLCFDFFCRFFCIFFLFFPPPLPPVVVVDFIGTQFSRSVMSHSLWPHGLQHTRPSCPSPTPRVYSNSCPSSRWCHPTISSSVVPFSSCPQSFPASGSF